MTTLRETSAAHNGRRPTTKARLVMIGNGMAGVRAVEEILSRGGGDKFDIIVFGDEPYGNYNRILLSNVLAGTDDPNEIYLNPLDWYTDNDIDLRAGVRVVRIDTLRSHLVHADDGSTVTLRQADPGHRQPGVLSTDGRACGPTTKPGRRAFSASAPRRHRRDDRRGGEQEPKAVVIGGGLLGLEAARGLQNRGLGRRRRARRPDPDERPARRLAGAILRQSVENLGITVHTEASTTRVLGREGSCGIAFADGDELACDLVVVSIGIRPDVGLAEREISPSTAPSSSTTTCALSAPATSVRSASAPSTAARSMGWSHRCGAGAPSPPTTLPAPIAAPPIRFAAVRPNSRSPASTWSRSGTPRRADSRPTNSSGSPNPNTRHLPQTVVVRDGRACRAPRCSATSQVADSLQAVGLGWRSPSERISLMFDIGTPEAAVGAAELADDAQVCNCNGVSKSALVACVTGGEKSVAGVMAATRAGKGCGSCKGLVAQIVEWAAGGAVEESLR